MNEREKVDRFHRYENGTATKSERGGWVQATDHAREIAALDARIARLEGLLRECASDLHDWYESYGDQVRCEDVRYVTIDLIARIDAELEDDHEEL